MQTGMITREEAKRIESAVRTAGGMILSSHVRKDEIHEKAGPANFVTDMDVKIQKFLIAEFSSILPEASFFGEEETEGNAQRVGDGCTFFIDPIDGTTNFMFDYRNSCVSVGFSENQEMIGGWVFHPYTDQFWSALRGQGAWLNGKRLKVSDKGLNEGICAFGCARYNEGDRIFGILRDLFMRSLSIRNGGSAAIDLCRAASGSNVAYVEMKLQPYDYAAASLILTEAGGVITTAEGLPVTLNQPCSIVAGTKTAAAEIRELLERQDRAT